MKRGVLYIAVIVLFAGLLKAGTGNTPEPEAEPVPSPVLLRPFNHMVLDSSLK